MIPPVTGQQGVVYLLHFDRPFGHARHYMGWASDLEGRLRHHENGTGANLLRHVKAAGISWTLARTWKGDRYLERRMKVRGHTRRCPICKAADQRLSPDLPAEGVRRRGDGEERRRVRQPGAAAL